MKLPARMDPSWCCNHWAIREAYSSWFSVAFWGSWYREKRNLLRWANSPWTSPPDLISMQARGFTELPQAWQGTIKFNKIQAMLKRIDVRWPAMVFWAPLGVYNDVKRRLYMLNMLITSSSCKKDEWLSLWSGGPIANGQRPTTCQDRNIWCQGHKVYKFQYIWPNYLSENNSSLSKMILALGLTKIDTGIHGRFMGLPAPAPALDFDFRVLTCISN